MSDILKKGKALGARLARRFLADPRGAAIDFLYSPLFRWLAAGFSFLFVNALIMSMLIEVFKFRIFIASVISAELCTILRFFVNERWVFAGTGPIWTRFWKYHVANATSFVVWLSIVNLLVILGVHYLIASVLAVGISVLTSLATNFLWVWRKKSSPEVPIAATNLVD